jgi:hypothetical protein
MAYKQSPFIEDCIQSLKRQTIKSEIIISTSTPSEFLFQLGEKHEIPVVVNHGASGIANDWNFSLKQVKTKYITLAHQDDIYLPEFAEKSLKAANEFKDAIITFTDYLEIFNGKERDNNALLKIKRWIFFVFMPIKNSLKRVFWKKRMLSLGCPIAAPSVTYNLEQINNFEFNNEFSINLDWDAWYRLAIKKGRFVFVKHKLMKHRIHQESATTLGLNSNKRQEEDLVMFKRLWPTPIANLFSAIYAKSYSSNEE